MPLAAMHFVAASYVTAEQRTAAALQAKPAFLLHFIMLICAVVPMQVYWLDLDYLQVAHAAVQVSLHCISGARKISRLIACPCYSFIGVLPQVSASFSALLYVEYWSEQDNGSAHMEASMSWLQV